MEKEINAIHIMKHIYFQICLNRKIIKYVKILLVTGTNYGWQNKGVEFLFS